MTELFFVLLVMTQIKVRAERKCGEMLRETAKKGERATRGGDRKSKSCDATLKLDKLNITRDQSSRWQKLAAMFKLRSNHNA